MRFLDEVPNLDSNGQTSILVGFIARKIITKYLLLTPTPVFQRTKSQSFLKKRPKKCILSYLWVV